MSSTETSPSIDAVKAAASAVGAPQPSVADQKAAVVARIKLQRRRLQTQSALKLAQQQHAEAQAAAERAERVSSGVPRSVDPIGIIASLFNSKNQWTVARAAELIRRYPIAAAGVAGVAFAIGPGRVFRWATILAPFLMKAKR